MYLQIGSGQESRGKREAKMRRKPSFSLTDNLLSSDEEKQTSSFLVMPSNEVKIPAREKNST